MEGSLRLQCIGAVLLIFIKARGQKKKKKKEQQLSGGKNGSDLGVHNSGPFLFICGIARLLLPTACLTSSEWMLLHGVFFFFVCVCARVFARQHSKGSSDNLCVCAFDETNKEGRRSY